MLKQSTNQLINQSTKQLINQSTNQQINQSITINFYKSQILSYLESGTPALYHSTPSVLAQLDRIQDHLLNELGLTAEAALLQHNLAPLATRRDVSMLGMLHKITLGIAPRQFLQFICPQPLPNTPRGWRLQACRHTKQLLDPIDGTHSKLMFRSVYGLIYTNNLLFNGSAFQGALKMP